MKGHIVQTDKPIKSKTEPELQRGIKIAGSKD